MRARNTGLLGAGWGLLGLAVGWPLSSLIDERALLLAAVGLVFGVAAGLRTRAILDDQGLTAVNGLRSHRVAWEEVKKVTAGRHGGPLLVETQVGRPVKVKSWEVSSRRSRRLAVAVIEAAHAEHGFVLDGLEAHAFREDGRASGGVVG